MKKRLFEILDQMNLEDAQNGTKLVALSPALISVTKVKQGYMVGMGVDDQTSADIIAKKSIAIFVVINREEYFKRKEQEDK